VAVITYWVNRQLVEQRGDNLWAMGKGEPSSYFLSSVVFFVLYYP
jgi:hypothetical protein